jgi:hypothetical protein
MFFQAKKMYVIVFAALLALHGCGGGGSSSPPPNDGGNPPPPPPTGGITRTGVAFAAGPITSFGSVIVNGLAYDTSSATFTKDGAAATQANLAVGQFIVIKGTIDDDNSNGVAESVAFDDNVEGPVSSVDNVAGTIVVLGQTVAIGPGTSVDDSCPGTLDELLTVVAVEVSGPILSDGTIAATRIECKAVAGEMEVTGIVTALDTGAATFQINALVVDYSSATLNDFPNSLISNNDPVEAKGTSLGPNGELLATSVEFKGNRFGQNEGDHIEVEGFITRFGSATDFDVDGIPVTTNASTSFEGGSASDLGLNLKVEVEGEFNASDVLVATKVEIKAAKVVRITGLVDSVSGDSLVILGITINTEPLMTRFEDKTDLDLEPLTIGDINTDNYLEIRGQEFPAGGGEIAAALLEREDARSETILQGFLEGESPLMILGVTINTNSGTVFRDASGAVIESESEFINRVDVGSLIKAKGTESGTNSIAADEVEIENE